MNASSQSSTEVGWAGQYVAKAFRPHKAFAISFDVVLDLLEAAAESLEDLLHVATLLHRNDTGVVLFVDPNEEVLLLVVPDTASIRPVACHSSAREQWRDGLVEQEVIINQLGLLRVSHVLESVVLPFQVTCHKKLSSELRSIQRT